MKQTMWALAAMMAAVMAAGVASAKDTDPGIYGAIDVSRFPKPATLNSRPVTATAPAKRGKAQPIYVHVTAGEARHWHGTCQTYDACGVPVYFVTEGWFRSVYLPAIGEADGREQRYLIQAGRDREAPRANHELRGEE